MGSPSSRARWFPKVYTISEYAAPLPVSHIDWYHVAFISTDYACTLKWVVDFAAPTPPALSSINASPGSLLSHAHDLGSFLFARPLNVETFTFTTLPVRLAHQKSTTRLEHGCLLGSCEGDQEPCPSLQTRLFEQSNKVYIASFIYSLPSINAETHQNLLGFLSQAEGNTGQPEWCANQGQLRFHTI